jgi:CBS-domain-containing membrane protein
MKQLFSKHGHFVPGPRLARDLAVALALKGVLLLTIYLLFFGPAHRPPSDAAATAATLVGASQSKESR